MTRKRLDGSVGPRTLAVLALLLLAAAAASAQAPAATRISVVAWHPYPETVPAEEGGDPFGVPVLNRSGRAVDWMAGYYDAYYYPTVRFDGVLEEANRADFSAASYVEAYRARVAARLAVDTPVALVVNGSLAGGRANVTVQAVASSALPHDRLVLRAAMVEDDVIFPGKNGVEVHRFVARAFLGEAVVNWSAEGGRQAFAVALSTAVPAGWRAENLGVVAWVQKEGEATRFAPREVLQSATFLFRQDRPTVQVERSVLVEMYTATWCEACVYGDGAIEVLLAELGVPSRVAGSGWAYLRPPSPATAGLILAAGAAGAWLLSRRWPA